LDRAIPSAGTTSTRISARATKPPSRSRSARGYWLWKPYIVLAALKREMADGDLLFYCDAVQSSLPQPGRA